MRLRFIRRLLLLCTCSALIGAQPALAHTRLTASAPAAGDTVTGALREIRLSFSEAVDPSAASFDLLRGDSLVLHAALLPADSAATTLRGTLPAPLPAGGYTVRWRAASRDGHAVHGTLVFTVVGSAPAPGDASAGSTAAAGDQDAAAGDEDAAADEAQASDADSLLSITVRWGELGALLLMLGCVAFVLVVLRRVARDPAHSAAATRAAHGAWPLALAGAALSVLTLLLRLWLQSVMLYGADSAFDTESLRGLIGETVWGAGWRLQAIATVAFALGLLVARSRHGRRVGWLGAAVAALLLAAVPALSGHAAAVEGWTALAIASDWLHVSGAGVWLGTLAALLLAGLPAATTGDHPTATFAAMVAAFSPLALLGAGTAGATGVVATLLHLHRAAELWSTGYGRALLLKLALLGVVAAIGFYNWRSVLPSLHTAESPARLRRTAAAELGMGLLVLLVTAVLVALPEP